MNLQHIRMHLSNQSLHARGCACLHRHHRRSVAVHNQAGNGVGRSGDAAIASKRKLPTHNRGASLLQWRFISEGAREVARFRKDSGSTPAAPPGTPFSFSDLRGQLLYRYFNWRQDTISDLILILGLNAALLSLGSLAKSLLLDGTVDSSAADGQSMSRWWSDLYEIMVLSFGESFPDTMATPSKQVFSVVVAVCGLAAFALVLALVEQVVLELIDANVKRGSEVYESGHVLILGWCKSQRDLEAIIKLMQQTCLAYRKDGGTTVVVLTQREKLEMEGRMRRYIPEHSRYGTRLVFRQGSPLIPEDLQLVAASQAAATIIISDQSRNPDEADAQSVRCAILLDELDDYAGLYSDAQSMGHIVVEIKTSNAMPLLQYSCSKRVIAMPTGQLNARRLAKMVKRPFISWVSQRLFNFENQSSNYVQAFTELAGCTFGELAYRFSDGIVYGVATGSTGEITLNPDTSYVIQPGDELVMCRPTDIGMADYQPLPEAMTIQQLEAFAPSACPSGSPAPSPLWSSMSLSSMSMDALPTGPSPAASADTCTDPSSSLALMHEAVASLTELDGTSAAALGISSIGISSNNGSGGSGSFDGNGSSTGVCLPPAVSGGAWSCSSVSSINGVAVSDDSTQDWVKGQYGVGPMQQPSRRRRPRRNAQTLPVAVNYMIPTEYMAFDDQPEQVLVAGWADNAFMGDLLRELDSGSACLPCGSQVVFVNTHVAQDTLDTVMRGMQLENLQVSHVQADPLQRLELATLDLSKFKCAIVLCDERWLDPDNDDLNGIDTLDEPSVLRLDSLMMVVQLNVRKLLEEQALPPINIICQKVATAGLTRFEDRHRLPLGISVNLTSFNAKMLMQVAYHPKTLSVYAKLGECSDFAQVDAVEYCAVGESISFWELVGRAQAQNDVLIGYYAIPHQMDQPIESVLNPQGLDLRSRKRVWNRGDNRLKFIILRDKECAADALDEEEAITAVLQKEEEALSAAPR